MHEKEKGGKPQVIGWLLIKCCTVSKFFKNEEVTLKQQDHMVNRLLLVCLFFLYCTHIKSQSFDEKNFVHYTVQHGLSDNYISGLNQDSAGYIWVGTHHGLDRFDGSYFKQFFNDGT